MQEQNIPQPQERNLAELLSLKETQLEQLTLRIETLNQASGLFGFFKRLFNAPEKLAQQAEALEKKCNTIQERIKALSETKTEEAPIDTSLKESEDFLESIDPINFEDNLVRDYMKHLFQKDVSVICQDEFINISKEAYGTDWLAREIIQNFVDANKQNPGTLDGVVFTEEIIDEDTNMTRFTITGNWVFERPTALASFASKKEGGHKSAGGNGIGLKQTVLRYLRDYNVPRFDVLGENWSVNYLIAKADEINTEMDGSNYQQIESDWLVAELKKSENSGNCSYIIETDNPKIISSLQRAQELGVSKENEFLENPDFSNEYGAIKWLTPPQEGEDLPESRLFINGQVMNFKEKGESGINYWKGPELMTIQLNNINYDMSIDRPPTEPYMLSNYSETLIKSMTTDELIAQLRHSEQIWTSLPDKEGKFSPNKKGCFVIIENIVKKIQRSSDSEYKNSDFSTLFPGKYLCLDRQLSPEKITKLKEEGYILCPSYFGNIGMEKASSKISHTEKARTNFGNKYSATRATEKAAKEHGMLVQHTEIACNDGADFLEKVQENLREFTEEIQVDPRKENTFTLNLNTEIPKKMLSKPFLGKKDEEILLQQLRDIAHTGLSKNFFSEVYTLLNKQLTTFSSETSIDEEVQLIIKNNECPDEGSYIAFTLTDPSVSKQLRQSIHKEDRPEEIPGKKTEKVQVVPKEEVKKEVTEEEPLPKEEKPTNTYTEEELRGIIEKGKRGEPLSEEEKRVSKDIANLQDKVQSKAELSDEEKKLREKLAQIPVFQPTEVVGQIGGEVTVIKRELTEDDQRQTQELARSLPGIVQVVEELNKLVQEAEGAAESPTQNPVNIYLKNRGNLSYGQAAERAGYVTGASIATIIVENNQAQIPSLKIEGSKSAAEEQMNQVNDVLKEIINRTAPKEDHVDEFKLVTEPTEKELKKLHNLREYVHLVTGVAIPNELFIYEGTGSKGINIGQKAIGLHRELFALTDKKELLGTFLHEIVHNDVMSHDNRFIHGLQGINAAVISQTKEIAKKLFSETSLSPKEKRIMEIENDWEG